MKVHNYNRLVEEYFNGRNPQEGEVGIEIEVEGRHLLKALPSYWAVHEDGSLRGESAEYVLSKPVQRRNVLRFLQYLHKRLDDNHAELIMSNRTSVHVHLNMQGHSIRQVYALCCLYLMFEGVLTRYAGADREGNLFCLRATDAEFLINRLVQCLQDDTYSGFTDENRLRYASLNICALPKFNSLEFRAFRGTVNPDLINAWVTLLLCIKDAAVQYADPRTILQEFSALGTRRFFEKVFPPPLCNEFNWPWYEIEASLWESTRLVQDVAFAIQWEVGPPVRPRMFPTTADILVLAPREEQGWRAPDHVNAAQVEARVNPPVIDGAPVRNRRPAINFAELALRPAQPIARADRNLDRFAADIQWQEN